ncbi:hypothetical protein GCM10009846_03950 [Agrococcus versicolor]|uniref:PIN like domain-containing protein n=1 Tax=Agrococcus versicolor TaxID=501482 RepID=A0ABN3AJS5_9MICO
MRSMFPEHFPVSEDDRLRTWKSGRIVFDTNVLLNLLRYSKANRDDFLEVMSQLEDRLWLPHQVALEYLRNWREVSSEQKRELQRLIAEIEGMKPPRGLESMRATSTLDAQRISKEWEAAKAGLRTLVEREGLAVETQRHDDGEPEETHSKITELYEGKVGEAFGDDRIPTLTAEALKRIKAKTPPGFEDRGKDDGGVGDVFVWLQLLEFADRESAPIIFVTDDTKSDWWHKHRGERLGPRTELIAEFTARVGQPVLFYSSRRFLEVAKETAVATPSTEVIEEAGSVAKMWSTLVDRSTLMSATEMGRRFVEGDMTRRPDPTSLLRRQLLRRDHGVHHLGYYSREQLTLDIALVEAAIANLEFEARVTGDGSRADELEDLHRRSESLHELRSEMHLDEEPRDSWDEPTAIDRDDPDEEGAAGET